MREQVDATVARIRFLKPQRVETRGTDCCCSAWRRIAGSMPRPTSPRWPTTSGALDALPQVTAWQSPADDSPRLNGAFDGRVELSCPKYSSARPISNVCCAARWLRCDRRTSVRRRRSPLRCGEASTRRWKWRGRDCARREKSRTAYGAGCGKSRVGGPEFLPDLPRACRTSQA
jgi:hypothetical protein